MKTAPLIPRPQLPDLEPGDLSVLESRAVLEAVQFTGVEFAGLTMTDAVLTECSLARVSVVDSSFRGIRISETLVTSLNAPVFAAPLSQWRDVTIETSRIGSAELFEASLTGVRISGSKLGYVNLRGAGLANVIIENCTIDELDLGGATAKRVAITGCTIGTLDVTRATLTDVDLRGTELAAVNGLAGLRGVTIDEDQLASLSWHLAQAAGIIVE